MEPRRRLLAAPDKFRGTITAHEVAAALARGAAKAGWTAREVPLADGGEGTLEVLGGPNRASVVTGPLGEPVEAGWRLDAGVAVVETARAAGLAVAGGATQNDPVAATTRGAGELIAAAIDAGAGRVVVAVGGSATTDGGLGAVDTLQTHLPFPVPVIVACDVTTGFLDAAPVFAPQKGAGTQEVRILAERLSKLAERYAAEWGVDVTALPGAGAGGGLAGGLAALGAKLVPGFDLIAETLDLDAAIAESDLVVTGEGQLDATSFAGKVVGGVLGRSESLGVEAAVIAGAVAPELPRPVRAWSLAARFGSARALAAPERCIIELVAAELAAIDPDVQTGGARSGG